MNGNNFYSVFFSELKKKWFIAVILALVLGAGLAFEKRGSGGVVSVSTSAYAQNLVRVVLNDNVNVSYVKDEGFFSNSTLTKYAFMKESEKKFDYSKFNANFPLLNEENKFGWINKRLWTASFYPNLFVISFCVIDEDAKDMEYTNANVEKFVAEYVAFCDKELQKAGIGHIEVVDKIFLPAEGATLTVKSVASKYGIVGAVLGFCLGILIIAGLSMRKIKND